MSTSQPASQPALCQISIFLSRFDYIFIADGQCDSPSPSTGTVVTTMETNDRSVSRLFFFLTFAKLD